MEFKNILKNIGRFYENSNRRNGWNWKNNYNKSFNKLVIANDTGSAIKGAVRGDIFFGSGVDGEDNASYQSSGGEYFLLLPQRVINKLQ